jgi:hypothetical protein
MRTGTKRIKYSPKPCTSMKRDVRHCRYMDVIKHTTNSDGQCADQEIPHYIQKHLPLALIVNHIYLLHILTSYFFSDQV